MELGGGRRKVLSHRSAAEQLMDAHNLHVRLAGISAESGRRFAVLSRTAWGERPLQPFRSTNSIPFKGRIIGDSISKAAPSDEEVVIRFHHPIFSGVALADSYVEVVANNSKANVSPGTTKDDANWYARGSGFTALNALAVCPDAYSWMHDPCASDFTLDCPDAYWIYGPPGSRRSDPEAYTLHDIRALGGEVPKRHLPAVYSLLGYVGPRRLPDPNRFLVVMRWDAASACFRPSFQSCRVGAPPLDPCCWLIRFFDYIYPDSDWRQDVFGDSDIEDADICLAWFTQDF
jgi:hypothetical protein